LLRQDSHTVEVCHAGTSAIELAGTFKPDVALVDLGMPGMNGFEVAERLRTTQKDLLLIAVSGYSGEESRRRARGAGFDEYVIKPLDPQTLEDLLTRHAR
jgi:CheY-like chemotaxis protein